MSILKNYYIPSFQDLRTNQVLNLELTEGCKHYDDAEKCFVFSNLMEYRQTLDFIKEKYLERWKSLLNERLNKPGAKKDVVINFELESIRLFVTDKRELNKAKFFNDKTIIVYSGIGMGQYVDRIETDKNEVISTAKGIALYYFETYLNNGSSKGVQHENLGNVSLAISLVDTCKDDLFEILKDYFSPCEYDSLETLIRDGGDLQNKVIFKGHGNQLADTFKQLYQNKLIIVKSKNKLCEWIVANFKYMDGEEIKDCKFETIQGTMSKKENPCMNPIIKIENSRITRAEKK